MSTGSEASGGRSKRAAVRGRSAPDGMTLAVEGHALVKEYRDQEVDVHALRGVDIEVGSGEFVAVMGPSGSGKSTLLHLLGGLDVPTSGDVSIAGEQLAALSKERLAALRRNKIGFVFQLYNLIASLTVVENVALPAIAAGESPTSIRGRLDELLGLVGLDGKGDRFPPQLSGGEQQRVAVARALVREPAVVLADEPTGNLDSRTGEDLLELFVRCNTSGQTIVLVTHDSRVASAARRVLFMRDGAFIEETELKPTGQKLTELVQLGDEKAPKRGARTSGRR
jgi:putative ABC transport system ATP-binding protein